MFELWSAVQPSSLHFKQAGDERSRNNYTETFSENLVLLSQEKKKKKNLWQVENF